MRRIAKIFGAGRFIWRVGIKFEPRDLWVGVYWNYDEPMLDIYVCFIPLFPINVELWRVY